MADLSELLERMDLFDGSDEALEGDIYNALVGVNAPDAKDWYGSGLSILRSIDAALAFAERVLPGGVDITLKLKTGGKYFHADFETDHGDVDALNHLALPLAIVDATLNTLIAKETP